MSGIDAYTKLLLHGDESPLVDSSLIPKSLTLAGSIARSATQSKFGGYAISQNGATQYITVADSADWAFGTGDFTIDFWVYFNALPTSGQTQGLACQISSAAAFWKFHIRNDGGYYIRFDQNPRVCDTYSDIYLTINAGEWHHIALVRYGTSFKIYFDGVTSRTATASGSMPDLSGVFNVGRSVIDSGLVYTSINGYIDEFRVSKGIARWTGNFTPPTAPYTIDSVTSIKKIMGVTYANIKKINSLALASVKKYEGVS